MSQEHTNYPDELLDWDYNLPLGVSREMAMPHVMSAIYKQDLLLRQSLEEYRVWESAEWPTTSYFVCMFLNQYWSK